MPRILIAPDSFKGTLTARQAALALGAGLQQALPQGTFIQCPLADGGEGTLDCLQSVLGGALDIVLAQHATGRIEQTPVYRYKIGKQSAVVLEVATAVGPTPAALSLPIHQRTTLGIGQLLKWCLSQEIDSIQIGLGGSCTNEGGVGVLAGLGAELLDAAGNRLAPTLEGLAQLAHIDVSKLDPRIFERQLTVLSDVNSPLCGSQGATQTFGPQKGLTDPVQRGRVDQVLARYAALAEGALAKTFPNCESVLGTQFCPGAGAAGGLGFALQLLGANYTSGAQWIAHRLGLPQLLEQSDWLITGEGCSDSQTLAGKAPWVVAQIAQVQGVPATLLSGMIRSKDFDMLQSAFPQGCFSLAPGPQCCFEGANIPISVEDCQVHAVEWLTQAGIVLGRLWTQGRFRRSLA